MSTNDSFSSSKEKRSTATSVGVSDAYAKVPPQDLAMERALLGSLMIEQEVAGDVMNMLKKDYFYDHFHQIIFESIQELFDENIRIDQLSVRTQLKKNGKFEEVGGQKTLFDLTDTVATAGNVQLYAGIIVEKYVLRKLIGLARNIQRDAFEEAADLTSILNSTEKEIYEILQDKSNKEYKSIGEVVVESLEYFKEMGDRPEGIVGTPTGFERLDEITSGWQNSDLVVIAGRPGTGKTAFALSCVRNAAVDHNVSIAFFSLEMSAVQLVTRLISSETEIEQGKFRRGQLNDEDWVKVMERIKDLEKASIFIDDSGGIDFAELKSKCRRLKAKHGIQMIIVDYLQLIHGDSEGKKKFSREQEISYISRSLKELAKELDVPIIALSQMSREIEKRTHNKKPRLSDLRESGAIEQDADMVMFLYREDKTNKDDSVKEFGKNPAKTIMKEQGITQLIIEKHRNGETGEVNLKFEEQFVKFRNLSKLEEMQILNAQAGTAEATLEDKDFEPGALAANLAGQATIPSSLNKPESSPDDDEFGESTPPF